jgi:quercetin 2,3-dioxygenase
MTGAGGLPMVDVRPSRETVVGDTRVRRALPQRGRRTVGAWCFIDHMGPVPAGLTPGGIGPHPHTGLHTVTWLVQGELLHRDSLGSEQAIRPGQLNLMTAGHGVSHAEEPTGRHGDGLHGVQLWVAQPEATRHDGPAFEHHSTLPQVELGAARATVLVGALADATSPARRDTELVGLDLRLAVGSAELPLVPSFEHALVVLEGAVRVGGRTVSPGQLAYLGPGREELGISAVGETRLLLVGGAPFESHVTMWWNFVGRSRDEVGEAGRQWNAGSDRFGDTGSSMARVPAPPEPWAAPSR